MSTDTNQPPAHQPASHALVAPELTHEPALRLPEQRSRVRADELRRGDDLPLGRHLTRFVTQVFDDDLVLPLPWSGGTRRLMRIRRVRVKLSDGASRIVRAGHRFTVIAKPGRHPANPART